MMLLMDEPVSRPVGLIGNDLYMRIWEDRPRFHVPGPERKIRDTTHSVRSLMETDPEGVHSAKDKKDVTILSPNLESGRNIGVALRQSFNYNSSNRASL